MEENRNLRIIDLERIAKILKTKKKVYMWVGLITFVLSCVWIIPEPRYYDCEVALAPEANDVSLSGGLSSIASSFGFDLGGIGGTDAIYPLLYPDLFESPEFLVGLFDIKVKSLDGLFNAINIASSTISSLGDKLLSSGATIINKMFKKKKKKKDEEEDIFDE